MSEQSGAIRMVAFGVLEFNPVDPNRRDLFEKDELHAMDGNSEVMGLVRADIDANGWKLNPKQHDWKDRLYRSKFVLLGPLQTNGAVVNSFSSLRVKIGEGTLQEVCLAAVHYLDHGRTSV